MQYLREFENEVVCIGHFGSEFDLLISGIRTTEGNVFGNCAREKDRLLLYYPYLSTEPLQVQLFDVLSVDKNLDSCHDEHE